jgi:hypothetical protein
MSKPEVMAKTGRIVPKPEVMAKTGNMDPNRKLWLNPEVWCPNWEL